MPRRVHTEGGRLYLFVAVDRASKLAFARLHERATRRIAAEFLEALAAAVPYRIHTVLTDDGTQFVDNSPIAAWQLEREAEEEREAAAPPDSAAPGAVSEPTRPPIYRRHAFDAVCERLGVEHRLTRPRRPRHPRAVAAPRGRGGAGPDAQLRAARAWWHRSGPRTTTASGPRSTASSQHATSCSRARGRPSRRSSCTGAGDRSTPPAAARSRVGRRPTGVRRLHGRAAPAGARPRVTTAIAVAATTVPG